ncbi:2-oxoacid:acceptor oxidoreductase family protein [Sedimentibacter sp. B4]|uniref:2-oxoacid:acceptor oxidoreductase family protein n=1 Tax=Sedimentibacter sp. B4 TaxID=304766 RepID=UPI0002F931A8|nr:2-oxoacid:acceptor oxidoreductase family protein [Sedimentibacter sp. B4]
MLTSLLVAGFGGQGVMMIGKLIGECAFEQGVNVTFLPSYGPEQRGGTANCTVILSDEAIGSPVSDELDVLCAMNQPSLIKFVENVKPGGVIIANSSLVDVSVIERKDVKIIDIDADTIAYEIGSNKIANIIMFAAYMEISNTMPMDSVRELVLKKLGKKPEFVKLNAEAFDKGVEIAKIAFLK